MAAPLAFSKGGKHNNNRMLAMSNSDAVEEKDRAKYEWRSFLFIAVCLFPILAIAIVGGYGFLIWAFQVFFLGPPGHG